MTNHHQNTIDQFLGNAWEARTDHKELEFQLETLLAYMRGSRPFMSKHQNLIFCGFGDKIGVIKALRRLTVVGQESTLGLKAAKDLVESSGWIVCSMDHPRVGDIRAELSQAGAILIVNEGGEKPPCEIHFQL